MSEPTPPPNSEPAPGLPPVLPPSGTHIVRLFVVPAVIVLGVVVLLLGVFGARNWFFGFARTPEACLADMKSDNPDARWRAANDLAQVLKRDPRLAADPKLGLDLADVLNGALADLEREEQSFADKQKKQPADAEKKEPVPASLKAQRKYVQFLSACLGNLSVPVGVPLLTRLARKEQGEAKSVALLRRHAVWALANLGENRKQFDQLPAEQRAKALAVLQEEARRSSPARADWARKTLDGLNGKDFGVIDALSDCAGTRDKPGDPDLRFMTAFALGFWSDSPDASKRKLAEDTLLRLSNPDAEHGQGERIVLDKDD
jgi:hypothetical protein